MGVSGTRQRERLEGHRVGSWRKASVDHEDMGVKVQKEVSYVLLQMEKSC